MFQTRAAKTFDAVTALVYALKNMSDFSNLSPEFETESEDFCRSDELSWKSRSALMEQIKMVSNKRRYLSLQYILYN